MGVLYPLAGSAIGAVGVLNLAVMVSRALRYLDRLAPRLPSGLRLCVQLLGGLGLGCSCVCCSIRALALDRAQYLAPSGPKPNQNTHTTRGRTEG